MQYNRTADGEMLNFTLEAFRGYGYGLGEGDSGSARCA